jgi:uncharacterized membrane protein
MLPDPLHPALVHFPIVLALLAPLLAAGFLWAIAKGRVPARAWLAVVVLQAVILGSGWLTAETGEDQEERVERVVRESVIKEHEEAAEWFLWIAGLTLPLAGAGLLAGRLGSAGRGLALAGTLVTALTVARVGHTGGELVYKHGAALAYLDGPTTAKVLRRKTMKKLLSGTGIEIILGEDASPTSGSGGSADESSDSSHRPQGGREY